MASRLLLRSFLSRSFTSPFLRHRPCPSPALFQPTIFRAQSRKPPTIRFTSTSSISAPPPVQSLSQRFKALSKEYGYSALGVYLALSALDFPFCFLGVRYLGAERIGGWEDAAVSFLKPYWTALRSAVGFPVAEKVGGEVEVRDVWNDIKDAEEAVEKGASLWTELALAYAIHKSFIFVRVPLTAAVTPKVVKVLRGWGWNIGRKRTPKTNPPSKGKKPPPPSTV